MPAYSTYPTLLDEVKQISITKLKEFGYFEPDSFKSGQLTWSRRGQEVGSISISVDMRETPQATFFYTYNKEEQVNYNVSLTSSNSNLGIGKIWYFVCPHTGKRCRKLYGAGKYFLHRDAFPNAMYECQTYSKKGRMIDKVCKIMNGSDKLYEELYSKHFKTHYAGKPTKRYKEILRELEYIRQNQDQAFNAFLSEIE
ncbi:hypothetical protein [Gracilimonas mengyeensis]|uniref:Uncharacterized protein n=1 Tax=Gracilimonas mengyeensis TaxID=1302730 RepID=A0A521EHY9_9BACT|nr:hypothetical protein [Gracilimonas mengyeensis]SMO83548.1 hypothetical protein SAMN06265219_11261 [Gracilimonas mengyeensis]